MCCRRRCWQSCQSCRTGSLPSARQVRRHGRVAGVSTHAPAAVCAAPRVLVPSTQPPHSHALLHLKTQHTHHRGACHGREGAGGAHRHPVLRVFSRAHRSRQPGTGALGFSVRFRLNCDCSCPRVKSVCHTAHNTHCCWPDAHTRTHAGLPCAPAVDWSGGGCQGAAPRRAVNNQQGWLVGWFAGCAPTLACAGASQ
jgi:hypothetical protein